MAPLFISLYDLLLRQIECSSLHFDIEKGDVQTLEAEMRSSDYVDFSLERTAELLAQKFPKQSVIVLLY